jgi:hypothetical protein
MSVSWICIIVLGDAFEMNVEDDGRTGYRSRVVIADGAGGLPKTAS